jgi:hypothetical protein
MSGDMGAVARFQHHGRDSTVLQGLGHKTISAADIVKVSPGKEPMDRLQNAAVTVLKPKAGVFDFLEKGVPFLRIRNFSTGHGGLPETIRKKQVGRRRIPGIFFRTHGSAHDIRIAAGTKISRSRG